MAGAGAMLSVFIREPEFQGQTKDRLATADAQRIVEQAIKDPFDHWLAGNPSPGRQTVRLRGRARRRAHPAAPGKGDRAQEPRYAQAAPARQARRLHRPGRRRARSCSSSRATAPAARPSRPATARTQAILPLRGKILNVASAGVDQLRGNKELADLAQALGCGTGAHYRDEDLRYERIIIMTDADVDGAHIASLLITFFYRQMPQLIGDGHLYLAVPPLYRLSHGGKNYYARDEQHRDEMLKKEFNANAKVEVSRFKGLGEMMAAQLKETTMDPTKRTLPRVTLSPRPQGTEKSVERLMGNKPELRFGFIQENAEFAAEATWTFRSFRIQRVSN